MSSSFLRPPLKRVVAAALMAGPLLAGCSIGDDSAPPSSTGFPGPPLPPPRGSTTTPPTEPLKVTGEMTPSGTRLRFGEKAIVPVREYNGLSKSWTEGVVGIVVERIRRVPGTEIEGNFDDRSETVLEWSTVYYAEIVVTNESGNPMLLSSPDVAFRRSGGGISHTLMLGGELPGCTESAAPESFDQKGDRWTSCELSLSASSRPLREVHYLAPPYGTNAQHPDDPAPSFNEHYELGAIVWH